MATKFRMDAVEQITSMLMYTSHIKKEIRQIGLTYE